MTPEEEQMNKKTVWQSELKSLGIEQKRKNELNDRRELEALADNIKQLYYQDYKSAYSSDSDEEIIESNFD